MWILFLVFWQSGKITHTDTLDGFKREAYCEAARAELADGAAALCEEQASDRAVVGFCVRAR